MAEQDGSLDQTILSSGASPPMVELLGLLASSCAQFFEGLSDVIQQFKETGEVPKLEAPPKPLAASEKAEKSKGNKPGRPAKNGDKESKEKVKRKPNAFNMFVSEHISVLQQEYASKKAQEEADVKSGKIAGPAEPGKGSTDIFKEAVAAWSSLSDEEKAAYRARKLQEAAELGLEGPSGPISKPEPKAEAKQQPAAAAAPASSKAAAPTAMSPAATAAPAAEDAAAPETEKKKKKKKKRKSDQMETPAAPMQSDGQGTEVKKKKKKKHHHEDPA